MMDADVCIEDKSYRQGHGVLEIVRSGTAVNGRITGNRCATSAGGG
jgi:hypothetical protein